MLGLVFLSFLCCFGPGMLIKTMDRCYKYPALHIACYILNWCTVVVNPTVYFFRNEKYKAALKNFKMIVFNLFTKGTRNEKGQERVQTFQAVHFTSNDSSSVKKQSGGE
ncbi:G-protein coupled receptor moody isoform X1 [Eurytemora carolleeae]|uniref:G-protein coupled receptor moody isoform X1 n=1 Tax=Eurytemora carolleeae TaxID=1294199 RepID=UPI000C78E7D6|nr:G-protein coupled receptor moody isoform X1 [Eurytemora carolleeae]|eukprot:XP_023336861.1 G-protein coupled receptor moody-like isoform X1 [Eurytemora affinis]